MQRFKSDVEDPQRRVRRGVIGILSRGTTYLLVRRAPGIPRGGSWCFPGGHVEHGETSRRAIQRELAEELGIAVAPTQRLGSLRLADLKYVLAVWRVDHTDGGFRLARDEIAAAQWLTPQQIRLLRDGLPSNERVLEMLGV